MKLDIVHSIVALSMISPTAAQLVCPPSWQTGKTASGDLVSVDGIVFQSSGPVLAPLHYPLQFQLYLSQDVPASGLRVQHTLEEV